MNNIQRDKTLERITEGVKLAIDRLVEKTKKENGELVFSETEKWYA